MVSTQHFSVYGVQTKRIHSITHILILLQITGAYQPQTNVQDWRYYRSLLSAEEVRKVAFNSLDEEGTNLRTCQLPIEGGDSGLFKDMYGNNCAWYEEKKQAVPNLCSTLEVQTNCPLACGKI